VAGLWVLDTAHAVDRDPAPNTPVPSASQTADAAGTQLLPDSVENFALQNTGESERSAYPPPLPEAKEWPGPASAAKTVMSGRVVLPVCECSGTSAEYPAGLVL
jgi:hypothetical protein